MKKKGIVISLVFLVITLLAIGFCLWQYNQAYHEVNVEAGIAIAPDSFLKQADASATYAEGTETDNTRVPGDYIIYVKTKLFKHKILMHVIDSNAPTAEAVPVRIDYGSTAKAEDFVKNISDATEITIDFDKEPDFSKNGEQDVKVAITDLGGNKTIITSTLTITYVKNKITIEAGSGAPSLSDFLLGDLNANLLTDVNSFDYNTVADYKAVVSIDGVEYDTTISVVDTVPPTLEVSDVTAFSKASLNIEKFIVFTDDVTGVHYEYVTEPDITKTGEQEVSIRAVDGGNNETVKTAKLTLIEDNEAPVIKGLKDFVSYSGHAISYKSGIEVTDNNPENLLLDIDAGNLDVNKPGEYQVTYVATDASGNTTSQTITITIKGKEYTDEAVYAFADEALAKIVKPGMTQRAIAQAIFNYVRKNLNFYTGHSIKLFWQQGAIDAFVDGIGDCYMYACMAKALLTRAGIPNIDIERVEGARPTHHYWNLVNCDDEGWYHFDCLTMKDGTKFFMWTDAQIKEYDETHPGYHTYDPSLYPEIK